MPKVKVYNLRREESGEIDLADEVFATEVNEALLYDIVKAQLASRRAGTAKTKGRAEVRGSTRKLYKQKGTGRARHGSIRAQQYVGGGKAHGPQPHSFAYRPTRKQRLGALKSALSLKLAEGQPDGGQRLPARRGQDQGSCRGARRAQRRQGLAAGRHQRQRQSAPVGAQPARTTSSCRPRASTSTTSFASSTSCSRRTPSPPSKSAVTGEST